MVRSGEISTALVAYFGFGTHSFPQHNEQAIVAAFPREDIDGTLTSVRGIIADLSSLEPDWGRHDLLQATEWARDLMHEHHPELNEMALDALAWYFSYGWK